MSSGGGLGDAEHAVDEPNLRGDRPIRLQPLDYPPHAAPFRGHASEGRGVEGAVQLGNPPGLVLLHPVAPDRARVLESDLTPRTKSVEPGRRALREVRPVDA